MASSLMLALYYNKNYKSEYLINPGGGALPRSNENIETPNLLNEIIRPATRSKGLKWTLVKQRKKTKAQILSSIQASIQGGDPVIVYTGKILFAGAHVYVIVGYDANTFYVNNPYPPSGNKPGGVLTYSTESAARNADAPTINNILNAGASDADSGKYERYNYLNAGRGSNTDSYLIIQSKYLQ